MQLLSKSLKNKKRNFYPNIITVKNNKLISGLFTIGISLCLFTSSNNAYGQSHKLTDKEIIAFVKMDFSMERDPESFPSPHVWNVFLIDYNNDGAKDAIVYATGSQEGAKFSFQGFGLYKNENRKMRLVDQAYSTINTFKSVTQSGKLVIVNALEYGPHDPQCCPSVKTIMKLSFSNDKIQGLK